MNEPDKVKEIKPENIYRVCRNCGSFALFFYNANAKEWECSLCGRAYGWKGEKYKGFQYEEESENER